MAEITLPDIDHLEDETRLLIKEQERLNIQIERLATRNNNRMEDLQERLKNVRDIKENDVTINYSVIKTLKDAQTSNDHAKVSLAYDYKSVYGIPHRWAPAITDR